jgi:hypothetical protein
MVFLQTDLLYLEKRIVFIGGKRKIKASIIIAVAGLIPEGVTGNF